MFTCLACKKHAEKQYFNYTKLFKTPALTTSAVLVCKAEQRGGVGQQQAAEGLDRARRQSASSYLARYLILVWLNFLWFPGSLVPCVF